MAASCEKSCEFPPLPVLNSSQFSGLGCSDNRSLNFYFLDSSTQWSLLHKLLEADHKVPGAVIISLNDDKIFAMDSSFTSQNLANFIQAFHEKPASLKTFKLSKRLTQNPEQGPNIEEIHAGNFKQKLLDYTQRKVPGKFCHFHPHFVTFSPVLDNFDVFLFEIEFLFRSI